MTTIRSQNAGNFNVTGTGDHLVYTVPASSVFILKAWSLYLVGGSLTQLLAGIKPSGSSTTRQSFLDGSSHATPWVYRDNLYQVLNAGDAFYFNFIGSSPQAVGLLYGSLLGP